MVRKVVLLTLSLQHDFAEDFQIESAKVRAICDQVIENDFSLRIDQDVTGKSDNPEL
jgi:hypothetical protein